MKRIMQTGVVVIVAGFLLLSCNKNTPKDVAYNWLTAFNHLDFDAAKKLSTNDTRNLLSSLQELTAKVTDSNKKELKRVSVTIKDVKETNDTSAVATYTSSDEPGKDQTLHLIKQQNHWLVQFSKIDLMGEVPGASDPGAMDADSTGNGGQSMPQDSAMGADTSQHAEN